MQIVRVPKDLTTPLIITFRAADLGGRHFLRLNVASNEATIASLKILDLHRAVDLPSAKKGSIRDINAGESITIETRGDDEAWLRLRAKANLSYVLRTHGLQPARQGESEKSGYIDTVIEIYDPIESRKLKEDDDGGEASGGDDWSSRLSLSSDLDTSYHVRIKNIESTRGTFVFEVSEGSQ
jgi:hypothetical protein